MTATAIDDREQIWRRAMAVSASEHDRELHAFRLLGFLFRAGIAPVVDDDGRVTFPAASRDNAVAETLARDYADEVLGLIADLAADPVPSGPDADLWREVFALAWHTGPFDPHGAYGALHGLRCQGAALHRRQDGTVSLLPPKGHTVSDLKEWLGDSADDVRAVLRAAAS